MYIREETSHSITVERSRFIAYVKPVFSEDEYRTYIRDIRKKHYDATHVCSAFVCGNIRRSSDDGEPSGTAGRPMLEVLSGAGLTDTAAVVTRYFGGTLLGTGGLVRAYSAAMQQGLQNTEILEKRLCVCLQITTDYNGVGKLQYLFAQREVQILDSVYEHDVRFRIAVPPEEQKSITAAVADATAGRAAVEEEGTDWY